MVGPFFTPSRGVSRLPPLENNSKAPRTRVNRQIRISPVRGIADNGDPLGVLSIVEALAAAHERGLDLVEVAPLARPPVVKIMDYGKFKFEQAKAARAAKKKQHVIHLKEVKYRPGIDDHDFDFKTRHAREFLSEGNKGGAPRKENAALNTSERGKVPPGHRRPRLRLQDAPCARIPVGGQQG